MIRVTDVMKNNSLVYNTGRHQYELDKIQNQLATGEKINKPSDDPAAATNQMFFRTRMSELAQFERNAGDAGDKLNIVDGQLGSAADILQRIRVLTVQASNGIYQGDDGFELKNAFAKEIDQHLRALIDLGNAKDATGRPIFGGHIVERQPFDTVEASSPNLQGLDIKKFIVAVKYTGDIGKQLHEVDRGQYIDVNLAGNKVFWGTNMSVTSTVPADNFITGSDQSIKIDGHEIHIAAGDRLDDIIDKINHSGMEVKAEKVGDGSLSLHTTSPHQIWLEDVESGTLLRDLGLVSNNPNQPPNNYADTARVSGNSIFDVVIKLRNDLLSKDQLEIGGRDLAMLDESINNMLRYRAELGAKQNRMEEHIKRIAWDKTYTAELLARSSSIDFPETVMNMKWLETVHSYSLNVGSRIIRPTLMDFLR